MQLTMNTDFSLRVLLYVAERSDQQISTKDISDFYKISHNHLVKVVNNLGKLGYLSLKRGRYGGGITLAKKPEEINIGQVVEKIEPMILVECFDAAKDSCAITSNCRLKGVLHRAKVNFIDQLKMTNLKDLINKN
ncbi:MAG: Rrf2 family transcriptional regulator [Lentisphaeraceae bacterium]|nr:Rrf2 family transcriptional regulator [Lentisphaeraceae bacterium]